MIAVYTIPYFFLSSYNSIFIDLASYSSSVNNSIYYYVDIYGEFGYN